MAGEKRPLRIPLNEVGPTAGSAGSVAGSAGPTADSSRSHKLIKVLPTELAAHEPDAPDVPLAIELAGVQVAADKEISIDVTLDNTSEGVLVSGTIQAHWHGPCGRCMVGVDGVMDIAVQELFCTAPVEGEQYALETEHVDLTPMVREVIMLELPVHAVPCPSSEPCPNLPVELMPSPDSSPGSPSDSSPGADPDGSAEAEPPRDPRWAALDQLRKPDKPTDEAN